MDNKLKNLLMVPAKSAPDFSTAVTPWPCGVDKHQPWVSLVSSVLAYLITLVPEDLFFQPLIHAHRSPRQACQMELDVDNDD